MEEDKNTSETNYIVVEGTVKTDSLREIELSDEASSILDNIFASRDMSDPDAYIFPNKVGKPNNPRNFDDTLNTIFRNAGLDHISGAHILRRTFATRMYDSTKDLQAVAAYIGDSPETVTKHYIAVRRRIREGNKTRNIVPLPKKKASDDEDRKDNGTY